MEHSSSIAETRRCQLVNPPLTIQEVNKSSICNEEEEEVHFKNLLIMEKH